MIEDVFPTKNGDIPASYVSLPEGTQKLEYNPYIVGIYGLFHPQGSLREHQLNIMVVHTTIVEP